MRGATLPTETVFVMEMSPIKFGLGATDEIAHDVRRLGLGRVLVFTDRHIAELGLPERIRGLLGEEGVKAEIYDGVEVEPTFDSIMFLHRVSDLPVASSDLGAIGFLAEFLDRLNPHGRVAVKALYRTLILEIQKRSNFSELVSSFEELGFGCAGHQTSNRDPGVLQLCPQREREGVEQRLRPVVHGLIGARHEACD